ncbi:Fe-S cluster biogenesis protein NfuA, 4Fe-4S-binding domain [Gillisia sp. Hel1_33_143]|uniref:NifU family protein n=1 Tax=Gillisia sp. Hel1_33_143 TaxID=1336796 RepID=UPI00087D96A1|nr:NifU family protein [Gillisia sp. Hel1_33_143]SDR71277.1 Fe-S cluster biogenesis protein NfuA, 4Fe-4S-binding domain [Gillisia sp. Hel1_33_143]
MNPYTIHIQPTTNPAIVKFETNQFLTRHDSFEFKNIEEAAKSPLAQQLFYLPFVKTVFITQNFIAIEKYNIVEWSDVQEEVADQLKEYLNSGSEIIKTEEVSTSKKVPVTVYAESTPNPSVMKFVANKKLVIAPIEFKNIDDTKNAPMARKLFNFPFVKEIFMDENYISVNKYDVADWNEITMEIREFIRIYIEEGNEVMTKQELETETSEENVSQSNKPSAKVQAVEPRDLDEISQQVVDILDEYIKPAVASDGGNIMFDSYNPETKTVKVILQGACSGCPSSTATLKSGIETMMRDMLHGHVSYVEAVNG